MKNKNLLILVVSILFLAGAACGSFTSTASTATAGSPSQETLATPTAPSPAAVSPTAEASLASTRESPTEEPSLVPTQSTARPEPQPAAPAHFRPGAAVQLDEIHMLTTTDGWGLSGAYVLVTRDGGQTWREQTPPEIFTEGAPDKVYGAFLDAQTAWVIFSTGDHIPPEASVWHTTDGGLTWTPSLPLNHEAYGDAVWAEFAALDAGHVWVLIRGVYVGAGTHYAAQMFGSSDGGLTWTALPGDVGVDYTGLVFADARTGWLTWQTTGAYAAGPPEYAVTTDGGASWDSRELPPPSDVPDLFNQYEYCEPYQPVMLSARSIRLLVGCSDYSSPPKHFISYLYASEDGGATWSTYQLPEKVVASQDTLIFLGGGNALLLGRDMYVSIDGGKTWSQVKTVNWDGQFSFVNKLNGWAVARANGEIALVKTVASVTATWTWTEIQPTITK